MNTDSSERRITDGISTSPKYPSLSTQVTTLPGIHSPLQPHSVPKSTIQSLMVPVQPEVLDDVEWHKKADRLKKVLDYAQTYGLRVSAATALELHLQKALK